MVPPSTVACCAMVAPPRKSTPDKSASSTRQIAVSRSECGSSVTRPSRLVMAQSAMPSSTPAKIRNSAEAKYQVATSRVANATVATPPTDIAQASSLRLRMRSSAEVATRDSFSGFHSYSFDKPGRDQPIHRHAGLDPGIHHSPQESFEEDGLPGQARQ